MMPAQPSTPSRGPSQITSSTPATPETGYVLAQEDTPTRSNIGAGLSAAILGADRLNRGRSPTRDSGGRDSDEHGNDTITLDLKHRELDDPSASVSASTSTKSFGSSGSGSGHSDSVLEVLDNDDDNDELEDEMDFLDEEDEGEGIDAGEPLVGRSKGRRRRRRWEGDDDKPDRSLIELLPPLILAHPLPLLPLLALLPYNFLPAGVIFFIPIICVLALLSSCAHIVIVYLAWYLKVPTFEDVFATVMGKYGRYGRWGGTAFVIVSTLGLLVGWLETLYPLLQPLLESYLPANSLLTSRMLWTLLASATLLPTLLPSRMSRSLNKAPIALTLLLPVVAFLVIGRTVEIMKALEEGKPPLADDPDLINAMTEVGRGLVRRKFGLGGGSSAGAGITTLTIFLSPHLNTLPLHSSLDRNKRSSFPIPCLASTTIILVLSLPLALVPYYLLPPLPSPLPTATPTTRSGVFARLPAEDGWVNLARVLMCAVALGSSNMWLLRGRDAVLKAMSVERGERYKAGRWVGLAMWTLVVLLASIGGWVAEKIEILGVIATIAVCWFLPSIFFIVTFHVRSPLSIIFPHTTPVPPEVPAPAPSRGHSRIDSVLDPSADVLLARKERQLQKRRLGRRLWQDLIVYVGILPVGCITLAWSLGSLVGIW